MKVVIKLRRLFGHLKSVMRIITYPNIHKSAVVHPHAVVLNPNNLYMEEQTSIQHMSRIGNLRAKFVLKKWSGSAAGLYVIPGNHMSVVGKNIREVTDEYKDEYDKNNEYDKDVVVDEDVWIGARVSLLNGVHIGRGAILGTGSVIRTPVPPYAVTIGNPAKVVGFRFTPEEIIQHEKILYPESERLPLELLEKNYKKYFLDHIKEIKAYTGLICK